jgi:hypothetical protein
MASVTGHKAAPKKGRMRRTTIEHHGNGKGHTVRHEFAAENGAEHSYPGVPDDTHAVSNKSKLMTHLRGAIPDDEAAEGEAPGA